jgi:hypothetical protein
MPSQRQLILEEFRRRLQQISVANGFDTDAGAQVFLGEIPAFGPDDPDTAVAIEVGDDTPAVQALGDRLTPSAEEFAIRLPANLQALASADLDAPYIAREQVISDLKRAIETGDAWPDSVGEVSRGQTRSLDRDEGSTAVGAEVEYSVLYVETWGTP